VSEGKGPLRSRVLKVIDTLKIGVPTRDLYHYLKYILNRPAVQKNRDFLKSKDKERSPFPAPRLIYKVAGHFDIEAFHQSGSWSADFITAILKKNGLKINDFPRILDFGCGCGRVTRHWQNLIGPEIHGCDYQRPLVRWCQGNLAFARFAENGLLSRLNYPDRTFGLIYAISVFTHLDEQGQHFWIGELSRTLTDGGYLMVTVHGTTRLAELSAGEQESFRSGRPIFHQKRYSGTNVCATYHPKMYVEEIFGREFKLMDFVPGGALDANQDVYLFGKS
jgi:SAM-dependent methyltransferase